MSQQEPNVIEVKDVKELNEAIQKSEPNTVIIYDEAGKFPDKIQLRGLSKYITKMKKDGNLIV